MWANAREGSTPFSRILEALGCARCAAMAIAGGVLALTILGAVGLGKAAGDAVDGRGRRPYDRD